MYSKIAKAAMHEIPWNAKPTFSSASVISETLYLDKIDYFFLASGFFFLAAGLYCFLPPSVLLLALLPREDVGALGWFASVSLNCVPFHPHPPWRVFRFCKRTIVTYPAPPCSERSPPRSPLCRCPSPSRSQRSVHGYLLGPAAKHIGERRVHNRPRPAIMTVSFSVPFFLLLTARRDTQHLLLAYYMSPRRPFSPLNKKEP